MGKKLLVLLVIVVILAAGGYAALLYMTSVPGQSASGRAAAADGRGAYARRDPQGSYRGYRGTRAQHRALRRAGESRALPRSDALGVRLHERSAGIRGRGKTVRNIDAVIEPQARHRRPGSHRARRALRQRGGRAGRQRQRQRHSRRARTGAALEGPAGPDPQAHPPRPVRQRGAALLPDRRTWAACATPRRLRSARSASSACISLETHRLLLRRAGQPEVSLPVRPDVSRHAATSLPSSA